MTGGADVAVGVDVGTQGARAIAVDFSGRVIGRSSTAWSLTRGDDGFHEQAPERWLAAVVNVVRSAVAHLGPERIAGVAITATSGSLVLSDRDGTPVRPAIMWDDTRAVVEARELAADASALTAGVGLRLRPSHPLAKLAWLARHEPHSLAAAHYILHQSDWLLWRLGGTQKAVTDPTNALKTGYDPVAGAWLPVVARRGWIDRLPEVLRAGAHVGGLARPFADRAGLATGTPLITAMTDANTATLSAGLFAPGEWSATLGTGLSLKVRSRDVIADASGGVYSHAHPYGGWLATGTSHTGGGAITEAFGSDTARLGELAVAATRVRPGAALIYPLAGRGEFFPFWAPTALGFTVGEPEGAAGRFRATIEGIAVIERLAVDRLLAQGAPPPDRYAALGGATNSALWNRIRASILEVPLVIAPEVDTAFGAVLTVVAALGGDATRLLGRGRILERTVHPEAMLTAQYGPVIDRYRAEFDRRGFTGQDFHPAMWAG